MKRIVMIATIVLLAQMLAGGSSAPAVQTPQKKSLIGALQTRLASDNLITQATQKRTDAPLISTPQDAKKAIQEGILGPIASKASNSLRTYPSSLQIRKLGNPKIRKILERGRNLLEAGKAAKGWNATRLSGFARQMDQYLKEAEVVANSAKLKNENTPREDCAATKDKCNQGCHDRDAGYFCFFDCRLNYLICLAGTLINTSGTLIS